MEVKEAIEFACIGREKLLTVSECHKIVDCLEQGEKYKSDFDILVGRWNKLFEENQINKKYRQMWEELKGEHTIDYRYQLMNKFEQKYFPKGV